MPTLLGLVPKLVIWNSVDAGMELRPVGALPVTVEAGVDVAGRLVVGAAVPGMHCE
jgi:hypothetical protein